MLKFKIKQAQKILIQLRAYDPSRPRIWIVSKNEDAELNCEFKVQRFLILLSFEMVQRKNNFLT